LNHLFVLLDQSLVSILQNYKNIKNISTYNGNSIVTGNYIGFCFVCSPGSTDYAYFVAYYNGIVVYNRNFTFKGYKSGLPYPRAIISVNNNNNVELFVSGTYSVFKLDINLNITASYFQDSTYTGQ